MTVKFIINSNIWHAVRPNLPKYPNLPISPTSPTSPISVISRSFDLSVPIYLLRLFNSPSKYYLLLIWAIVFAFSGIFSNSALALSLSMLQFIRLYSRSANLACLFISAPTVTCFVFSEESWTYRLILFWFCSTLLNRDISAGISLLEGTPFFFGLRVNQSISSSSDWGTYYSYCIIWGGASRFIVGWSL